MKRDIRRVLVIANYQKPTAPAVAEEITAYLESIAIECVVFGFCGKPERPPVNNFDLAISLGGDGTVLYASRILSSHSIPILPVNLGDFGFITEVTREEWREAFDRYHNREIDAGERLLLHATVYRAEEAVGRFVGLNDVVISATGISKIIRLDASLGNTTLGRYRADGIIVASPTGSTAYSAAAGGPILHPELEAMIINPICPFTLSHRPIVVPADDVIEIKLEPDQRTDVIITVDGQTSIPLMPGDRVEIRRNPEKAHIVRSDKRTFYEVLRSKLNWSGGPDA
ncbi:MAG: NAD(+)/NADH kinase [Spirochaetaceae bacterium]|nr:MAG: NAD(+)/NADH kinase [Spirochaetaceae bacterium]